MAGPRVGGQESGITGWFLQSDSCTESLPPAAVT
jgi:hypothetical protein